MKDKHISFPNRTFTDEQLQNMSYDDMILSIYHCQSVQKLSLKECSGVSHQLLRILLRIVDNKKLNMNKLMFDIKSDELHSMYCEGVITEEEFDVEYEGLVRMFDMN